MINFNKEELRDKVYACWLGKNVGGTLGGPFEGERKTNDCTGYTTPAGKPLPNDDLDLQLIWLTAMREMGPNNVDAKVLGEYWLEMITPCWNEYGISKANMHRGIYPPMSGEYKNHWKHSNGAWIRTEVWATLYPGDVDKAVHYACEDAYVDHGSGDGTYATIFVAALETAAFVVSDIHELINIALSKIPEKSYTYQFVTKVIECYENKKTWLETRNIITDMALENEELGWFQAPTNVSYSVIGLLYGEGDFKKSMLISCNCGDDTDCTCATVGSILGIINGTSVIPEDWKAHIGDDIITISINMAAGPKYDPLFPHTCSDLADRIMDMHHLTLAGSNITVTDNPTDLTEVDVDSLRGNDFAMRLQGLSQYYQPFSSMLLEGVAELSGPPEIEPDGTIEVKLSFMKRMRSQKVYRIRWLLPEGWSVTGPKSMCEMENGKPVEANYVIKAGERVDAETRIVAEISCDGHFDVLYVPIMLCN